MISMRELNGYESLLSRIQEKRARITVLGQGYIGLPLALLLCKAGYHVIGFDINKELIENLRNGRSRFSEPGIEEILKKCLLSGKYIPENRARVALKDRDVYIIAVQTPALLDGRPDLRYLLSALNLILSYVKGRYLPVLLIIESTIPPKTIEDIILPLLEKENLFIGEDIFLAYCPERAMPGRLLKELSEASRIIGVIDESSGKLASLLYSNFTRESVRVTHVRTAELVKLVENSYRDVNIAFANTIALICEAFGVDVNEVRALANLHPRVNLLRPGIGVGGSCLTKDPYFLLSSVSDHNINLNVIRTARKLNEELPKHAAMLITKAIKSCGKKPNESLITILGITYKGDVSDYRNSPVLALIQNLKERGFRIKVYDPLVKEVPKNIGKICGSLEEAVRGSDCIVIGAEHSILLRMDLDKIRSLCKENPIFFDGKHIFERKFVEQSGFEYLSVGCPSNVTEILREIAEHHIYES